MENLDIRVEEKLKDKIKTVANDRKRTMSDVARDLIEIGINAKKAGDVQITGPFGATRPLANLRFGGKKQRLGIRVDENLEERLKKKFGGQKRKAAREAIRLGSIVTWPETVKIEGILGTQRPFADTQTPDLSAEKAKQAREKLRE